MCDTSFITFDISLKFNLHNIIHGNLLATQLKTRKRIIYFEIIKTQNNNLSVCLIFNDIMQSMIKNWQMRKKRSLTRFTSSFMSAWWYVYTIILLHSPYLIIPCTLSSQTFFRRWWIFIKNSGISTLICTGNIISPSEIKQY